ncbi:MAG: hypothetical protein ABSA93_36025, partial [Streptosporangiaceae bacterium]
NDTFGYVTVDMPQAHAITPHRAAPWPVETRINPKFAIGRTAMRLGLIANQTSFFQRQRGMSGSSCQRSSDQGCAVNRPAVNRTSQD